MKVLIMEDETQIREGLETEIDWVHYGVREVYTAGNGERGIAIASQVLPDIILTDIRMPHMDGITAVKKFRKIQPDCSIVFISAYPEKEYFKEAINLHAVSFVEKPIDLKELNAVIEQAVHEQLNKKAQKEKEEQAFLYCGEKCVDRLCRGKYSQEEEIAEDLNRAGLPLKECKCFASLIICHTRDLEEKEADVWSLFCMNLQEQTSEAPVQMLVSRRHPDRMVCYLFFQREMQYERGILWIIERLNGLTRWQILAGEVRYSLLDLCAAYPDTVLLQNQAFYSRYGEVIREEKKKVWMGYDTSAWKTEFSQLLNLEKWRDLEGFLGSVYKVLMENTRIHYVTVQELYRYFTGELRRYTDQKGIRNKQVEKMLRDPALETGNLIDLHNWLLELIRNFQENNLVQEDELIARVKKYIHTNYEDPALSVREIAEEMGKSMSYLCVVFKKETGNTLNQYLTEVRIDAAKVLLDNPRNSIQMVAEKCGYGDSSYFARAFKKITGQSPSAYRGEPG